VIETEGLKEALLCFFWIRLVEAVASF